LKLFFFSNTRNRWFFDSFKYREPAVLETDFSRKPAVLYPESSQIPGTGGYQKINTRPHTPV
jgi:hypothetical protein